MTDAKTLYLIDGSGFIFRAYHALPALTNFAGTPVGAVLGFVNMMVKLLEDHSSDYVAVIFDAGRDTFRNRIYSEYKAHRPPPPDDLIPQFAIVREATVALGLPAIELTDFEADDIIATYTVQARERGMEVVIVSSDKDLMQLIAPGTCMFDAMKQKRIAEPEVMEKFGVAPERVRDVLALIGDTSDNVPGVPGIGPKTAAELIGKFGSLEGMLARTAEIPQPKRRALIEENAQKARLSYELIGLRYDVELPDLDTLAARPLDVAALLAFLQRTGLKSVLSRLQQKYGQTAAAPLDCPPAGEEVEAPAPEAAYTILHDEAQLAAWVEDARSSGVVALACETVAGRSALAALPIGFSLCVEPGRACYVPLAHKATASPGDDLFPLDAAPACALQGGQIPAARALDLLAPLLNDPAVLKVGHDVKSFLPVLHQAGIAFAPLDDAMLMGYALHAGEHGQTLDELAGRYLGVTPQPYDAVTGSGRGRLTFEETEIARAGPYVCERADLALRLHAKFKRQLAKEKLLTVYETIERPLIGVLSGMERRGIKVDMKQLAGLSSDFAARMREYEREIYALAGEEFNIGSPKQLGEVLFDRLSLPGGKKSSKTGAYATDSGVLEELSEQGHVLPARVLEWRQLAKLKNTYSDSLAQQVDAGSRRVHTRFSMAVASTGRLSSTDPNLQNIPIRTPEGKKIRAAFIAEPGNVLLSADYSQIELRLLAHMADIPSLRDAFRAGEDIHAITASQMFGVPLAGMNPDLRRNAKMINFGIIYGISAHGLATRLGIGRAEAGAYIERYFAQYPGIRDYMEREKEFAREHGYVKTLFGRRCHVPGIRDKNPARRQFSERAAINAPLQGTAADIIKRAMIAVARRLEETGSPARMLLQVHDELVFELPEGALERTVPLVKACMEGAAQLQVPLTVETGSGTHWGEAH